MKYSVFYFDFFPHSVVRLHWKRMTSLFIHSLCIWKVWWHPYQICFHPSFLSAIDVNCSCCSSVLSLLLRACLWWQRWELSYILYLPLQLTLTKRYICRCVFLLCFCYWSQGGLYVFLLFDYYACSGIPILLFAILQSCCIGWVFGERKNNKHIFSMEVTDSTQ